MGLSKKLPKLEPEKARAELARRHFYRFLQEFWDVIIPDNFVDNWHIPYLCEELQKVAQLVFDRRPKAHDIIINIPPGTSKSTICTVVFPVWCWTNDPAIRVITGSYSADLSTAHSVKSRDIIRSDKFRRWYPHIELKADMDNKTNYQNLQGGERIATSVGGTITGKHAHLIIVDDPLNAEQAASEADRSRANRWMTQTLSTRKVDKEMTPTILVMQRLHTDDCTGHMLARKGDQVKHICLPGELAKNVSPADLVDRYVDGLLDANRLNRNVLEEQKKDLGSYGYAGQIMQTPVPDGGVIWQKWFVPVPDNVFPKPEDLKGYGTDWDTAYTDKETNDASAFCISGMADGKVYIDKVGYARLEFPGLLKYMTLRPGPHYIEAKASGKSAKQTLKQNGIPAIEVAVVGGDKVARTRFATPMAEAGLVYVRESQLDMIYNDSEQGLLHFPNGKHDDLNDAIVQAIQRHSKPKREWQIY